MFAAGSLAAFVVVGAVLALVVSNGEAARSPALVVLIGLACLYGLLMLIINRIVARASRENGWMEQQIKRLQDSVRKEQRAVAELWGMNKQKSGFMAMASNELRAPLTSIVGYLKTLQSPQVRGNDDLREEFLDATMRQADRVLQLVQNLLTASQLEDRQLKVTVTTFSFDELVEEILTGFGTAAMRVRLDVPQMLPVVASDRQHVSQIVSNLLDNALKFSPSSAPVELAARQEGSSLVFSVRDDGPGIPKEEHGRIFNRFYQVDAAGSGQSRGVGLGLALVKELVQLLGGSVGVDSARGEGSTFTVRLPLRHPSTTDAGLSFIRTGGTQPVDGYGDPAAAFSSSS